MDSDNYPEETELQTIREWPLKSRADFAALFTYVHERWAFDYWQKEDATDDVVGRRVTRYEISTGGWSGNEDLLGAMRDNRIFWGCCWVQSRRGGHYIFELPVELFNELPAESGAT